MTAGKRLPELESRSLLAVTSNDIAAARALAERADGTLYVDERENWQGLPFRALLLLEPNEEKQLSEIDACGVYIVTQRVMKAGQSPVVGVFPLLAKPGLSAEAADSHWRDVHAPLALQHHAAMTSYHQLAVEACLSGERLDGIALCGFASVQDLRERFYTTPDSRAIIAEDVAKFADTERSPRRLIARVEHSV